MDAYVQQIINGTSPLYVVVRFDLSKGDLETLVPIIQEFYKKEVGTNPGFLSSRIHTNEEGTVLINYAVWDSIERYQTFFQEVGAFSEFGKKIQAFHPTTYRVFEIPL